MSSVNFKSMTMRAIPRVVASPLYTSATTASKLSFFDPPPPPQRQPNLRIVQLGEPHQGRGEGSSQSSSTNSGSNGPSSSGSLALTYNSTPPSLSYTSFFPAPLSPISPSTSRTDRSPRSTSTDNSCQSKEDHSIRKSRAKYQLDVGAYGIPKQCRPTRAMPYDPNASLAVSVGEDAYFVRNNAMGVADGVGGWSRKCRSSTAPSDSPSALFARHLMHFCSAELEPTYPPRPYNPSPSSILSAASGFAPPYTPFTPPESSSIDLDSDIDLQDQLSEELEELEDGIDVLMILERAYQRTLDAHVVDVPPPLPISRPLPSSNSNTTVPLMSGSSTVLLAVLDHVPNPKEETETPEPEQLNLEAVIRVAHLGDCMGMLVRGDQVVWRSEEMWWNFNTPVQLGPTSPATPLTSAHVFTLPVQEGDVLILASDGLSDNLWDEDVVDVVNGVRGGCDTLDTKALAAQLSEALCSHARRVSERKGNRVVVAKSEAMRRLGLADDNKSKMVNAIAHATAGAFKTKSSSLEEAEDRVEIEDEVPFARRAREAGKVFKGGKADDISVIVAVISPVAQSYAPRDRETE